MKLLRDSTMRSSSSNVLKLRWRKRQRASQGRRRLLVESLEGRRLLAADGGMTPLAEDLPADESAHPRPKIRMHHKWEGHFRAAAMKKRM
jgi:hypothetical protein